MQGEIYTTEPFGTKGLLNFDHEKMLAEQPEYFVFNGAAAALTKEPNVLKAKLGDRCGSSSGWAARTSPRRSM